MVRDGYVTIEYVHTSDNIADCGTKALAAVKIGQFEPILHGYEAIGIATNVASINRLT